MSEDILLTDKDANAIAKFTYKIMQQYVDIKDVPNLDDLEKLAATMHVKKSIIEFLGQILPLVIIENELFEFLDFSNQTYVIPMTVLRQASHFKNMKSF